MCKGTPHFCHFKFEMQALAQYTGIGQNLAQYVQHHPLAAAIRAKAVSKWIEDKRVFYEALEPPQLLPMNTVVKGVMRATFVPERLCRELAEMCPKFNKNRFAAVVFRIRDYKATIMLFANGCFMCNGARNYNAARYCVLLLKTRLNDAGYRLIADEYAAAETPTDPAQSYVLFDEQKSAQRYREAMHNYREQMRTMPLARRGTLLVEPTRTLVQEFTNSAFREMHRANVVATTMFAYHGTATPMTPRAPATA